MVVIGEALPRFEAVSRVQIWKVVLMVDRQPWLVAVSGNGSPVNWRCRRRLSAVGVAQKTVRIGRREVSQAGLMEAKHNGGFFVHGEEKRIPSYSVRFCSSLHEIRGDLNSFSLGFFF